MLKSLGSTKSKTRPGESGVGVDSGRARCEESKLDRSELDSVNVDGGKAKVDELGKKVQKCLSPKICLSPKRR